jgi:hypothetical protein
MTKQTEAGKAPVAPAFLTPDDRLPASLKEILLEADGCITGGFLIGATGCAHRAVDALLKTEKAEGVSHEARVRALGEKMPGLPQLLLSVLAQLGDHAARDTAKLPANTLQLLLSTVKAVAYEIYVIGPERAERLQHVRRLLESTERKPTPAAEPAERKATPAALAAMGSAPGTSGTANG